MSSLAINVLLLVLATIAYTIYLFQKHGEHAWDGIPGPLRWVYLPCYIIACVYITGLVLQWGLIVPGLIQWVLNITLYLLDWKLISLINQIISDLMYTPVLAMIVFFPCIMPHFKSDARFTYIFRMITLACLVATHIYTINFFDMGDAVEGLDMFIYDLELAVAAYLTYSVAREEYLGDGVDTEDRLIGQLKKLWGQAKRLFSMKKSLLIVVLLAESGLVSYAQSAQIKFDKLTHNFGMFSEKMPVVETEFSFTNTGDAPLVINQAAASCACTVPEYTKSPIQPGQKGTIKVIYNGTGKFPGRFKKSITIRTNGVPEMTRLYIEGEMVDGATAIRNPRVPKVDNQVKQPDLQVTKANGIPNLSILPKSIFFKDAAGTNAIVGGANSTITFQVKNTGKGVAQRCKTKITAKGTTQGIIIKDIDIPSIPAGQTKTVELPISANMNTQNGTVELAIQVDEPNGFGTDPHYLTVTTRAFEAPLVQITDYSLSGDAGSTLMKKIPFDLQLMLQNTRKGQASNVSVNVDVPQNVLMIEGNPRQSFSSLSGGETKLLAYSLIVNNNYQGTTIPIKIEVKEKYGKYAESRTINLSLNQALASTKTDVQANQQQQKSEVAITRLGSDVDKDIPTSAKQQSQTFVVIIANEHYMTVDGVPYAGNDGAMFEAYCRETLGIPQKNIRIAKDATLNGMKFQIDWLRQVVEAYNGEAAAIFYYAGHGIPDEQSHNGYLLPTDGYPSNMSSAYSLADLYDLLGSLPARSVTLFLDACFSGAKRDGHILASARGVAIKAKPSTPHGKMIVFSAAQGDETAYPYHEQQHGMFTYYLLKKLKDTKGEVSLGELSDYITQRVKQQSIVENNKMQTPAVKASAALADSWRAMKLK